MLRRDLIELLVDKPMTVTQIARLIGRNPHQVSDDLDHLLKSLRHTDYAARIEPALCRKCGFEFSTKKLSKPSRCPECHSTWLTEPRIAVRRPRRPPPRFFAANQRTGA